MIVSILKVIGMILLVIFALLIVILGVVLLIPIRYQFVGEYKESVQADVLVKWSPLLLKVNVCYRNKKLEYIIRLFGGVVMTNLDIPLSWIGRRFFASDKENGENDEVTLSKSDGWENNFETSTDFDQKQSVSHMKQKLFKSYRRIPKKQKQSILLKIKDQIYKIRKRLQKLMNQLKRLNEKKDALLRVYHSKRFEVAKEDLVVYIKTLWGTVRPKQLSGYVHFGLQDPATTGQVLGVLAMFLVWYDHYLQIQPDFEQPCLDGYLNGRGKIQLFAFVKLFIKLIFNKNLIKVIKKVQTILEA